MSKPVTPTSPVIGDTFGYLTITGKPERVGKYWWFEVTCTCGVKKTLEKGNVTSGRTNSCGCKMKEFARANSKYPWCEDTRLYGIWFAMVSRCTKPEHKSWDDYGGRGITVSKRWMSFKNFYFDMFPRPADMTMERRNNEKGYSKGNCVWATRRSNLLNRRNTVLIAYQGKQMNLIQLSELTGIPWKNIYHRMYHGATVEQAVRPVPFKSKDGQAVWNIK